MLILLKNPEMSRSSLTFKPCFPLQRMMLAVSLLCTHNFSVPLNFSVVIDVSLSFPYEQQKEEAFSELCLAVFRGRRTGKQSLMHYRSIEK